MANNIHSGWTVIDQQLILEKIEPIVKNKKLNNVSESMYTAVEFCNENVKSFYIKNSKKTDVYFYAHTLWFSNSAIVLEGSCEAKPLYLTVYWSQSNGRNIVQAKKLANSGNLTKHEFSEKLKIQVKASIY